MKSLISALAIAASLVTTQAGDSLFTSSLGKSVLLSNDRLARNWFLEVTGGPVFGVNGDFTRSDWDIPGVKLEAQTFEDIYDNAWLLGFRFGKHLGTYDAYFRFAYTAAEGGKDPIGTLGGAPITGVFSDYSDIALMGGIRREFFQPSRLHPYLGFEAGIRLVDGIDVDLLSAGRTALYDDAAVFTAEVTAGVSYDLTDAFRIGLETGLRYQGGLDEVEGGLLEDYNSGDSFLFVPLLLTGTLNF